MKRFVRSKNPNVTGGGGGGPGVGGTIQWGPDFGDDAGNDGITLTAQAALSLVNNFGIGIPLSVAQVITMPSLKVQGLQTSVNQAITFPSLAVKGLQTSTNQAITMPSIKVQGLQTSTNQAITMPALALSGNTQSTSAITLPALAISGNTSSSGAVTGTITTDVAVSDDLYLDEGSPNTNFGTATDLLAKLNELLGQNEQIIYIAWDLTGLTGDAPSSATISIQAETTGIAAENATIETYTNATQPFDETTDTWNSAEQPAGTNRENISASIPVTRANVDIALGAASLNNMLGNWFYIRIQGVGALGATTIQVESKENTNPPNLNLVFTL